MIPQAIRFAVSPTVLGEEHTLACPHCGSNYLHHHVVDVYNREEDAETGDHIEVMLLSGCVRTDHDMSGNPSSRRYGLLIHFWCESCHEIPVLQLAQHKGVTEVTWQSKYGACSDDT